MFRTWISFTFSFSDLPSILKHVTNAHATNRSTTWLTLPNYSATVFFYFNWTLATPQLCIFTVQTQFEISSVVDRPHKQSNLITIKNCLQIPLPAAEATAKAERRILHQVSQRSSTALLRSSAIPDSQLCTILMISAAFSLFERSTLHAKLDSQRPEIGWMTNIAPAHLCQHLCMFWKTFGTKSTSGLQQVVLTGPA